MGNKITEILDLITGTEADIFSKEGLVFSGISIPQDISKRNKCFKGWSQSFYNRKINLLIILRYGVNLK
jgi:hypothetical protein